MWWCLERTSKFYVPVGLIVVRKYSGSGNTQGRAQALRWRMFPPVRWHPTSVLLPGKSQGWRSLVGCSPWGGVAKSRTRLSDVTFTFYFHALEKEMATHSSVLAWRIPRTGEPGGLLSLGLHRIGHDWSDLAAACGLKLELSRLFHLFISFYASNILSCPLLE